MKTIKQFFQTISLKQLLIVFFAGVLVLVNTACSTTKASMPANSNPSDASSTSEQSVYPNEDTKQDTSAADAKAEQLVQEAEQRLKQVQSPEDYVEEVTPNKSLEQQAKDIGESVKQAAENAKESTQKAAENVKELTKQMVENVKESTEEATKNAAENTQQGLENLKGSAENLVDQAADAINQVTNP